MTLYLVVTCHCPIIKISQGIHFNLVLKTEVRNLFPIKKIYKLDIEKKWKVQNLANFCNSGLLVAQQICDPLFASIKREHQISCWQQIWIFSYVRFMNLLIHKWFWRTLLPMTGEVFFRRNRKKKFSSFFFLLVFIFFSPNWPMIVH